MESILRSGSLSKTVGNDLPGTFEIHGRQGMEFSDCREKTIVLAFGYTQCPDVCPTTTQHWQQVFATLTTEKAESAQFIFVTVDPDRDSPELLADYMEYLDARFLGFHAEKKTLNTLLGELHTFARKVPSRTPGQYSMDHSGSAYLIDSSGSLVDEIPYGTGVSSSATRLSKVIHLALHVLAFPKTYPLICLTISKLTSYLPRIGIR